MAATVPRILSMTPNYVAEVGYSVHVTTDKAGDMDVTLTEAQYEGIQAQLNDLGFAYIPTGEAA
jgi:hypothetical protein